MAEEEQEDLMISETSAEEIGIITHSSVGEDLLRRMKEEHGLDITVASDEQAEEATAVVCVSAQNFLFADNVFTVCSECGGAIQHRPHAPKKPPKICMICAGKKLGRPL